MFWEGEGEISLMAFRIRYSAFGVFGEGRENKEDCGSKLELKSASVVEDSLHGWLI